MQELESQAGLQWLVRLRWVAFSGQALAIVTASVVFDKHLPKTTSALVLVVLLSNLVLAAWLRAHPQSPHASRIMGGALALDTLLLAGQLTLFGGVTNPFSALFLVHIALSAVVLDATWTLIIAGLSIACYALLFLLPIPAGVPHHAASDEQFAAHLRDMWIAFTSAAALLAFFVHKIARTVARQRETILALREAAARNARLASITTLAAGAAHELGTPLGTIAIVARDLELAANQHEHLREDAQLILAEVERCHTILSKLAVRANQDTVQTLCWEELLQQLDARLGAERVRRLHMTIGPGCEQLKVPREHILQSLCALVTNACDAQDETDGVIEIRIDKQASELRLLVEDQGRGMSPEVLEQAGHPFFTTKEPGRGLGLGLFLVRAFAESRGGSLSLESLQGHGTCAVVTLPLSRVGELSV